MNTILAFCAACAVAIPASAEVIEYPIAYPGLAAPPACHPAASGSTHEITFDPKHPERGFWITGQNYDQVVRVTEDGGTKLFPMDPGSHPHGIEFDKHGRVWVTWEFTGYLVRLTEDGQVDRKI